MNRWLSILLFSSVSLGACVQAPSDEALLATVVAQTLEANARSQTQQTPGVPTEAPSPSETSTAPTVSAPIVESWSGYRAEKVVDYFAGFELSYPSYWELKVDQFELSEGQKPTTYTLKRDGYEIRILQGPLDAAGCLFPDDADREGMYARFGEYKEIDKGGGIVWRRAAPLEQPSGSWIVSVCEKGPAIDHFIGITTIGVVSLSGPSPDDEVQRDFDMILERVGIVR